MFEVREKLKRQIEILGLCLDNPIYKTFDLAELFKVEELTIKRDLKDLRSIGIDIHSRKNEGVCLSHDINKKLLVEMIRHYMEISNISMTIDKATELIVERQSQNALKIIVNLQICIDNSQVAFIDYNKEGNEIEPNKRIEPILIYQNEENWRLLAQEDGIIKQYLIYKIENVRISQTKFDRISREEFLELFKYSWKSWLGSEKIYVKLHLSEEWTRRFTSKIFVNDQKITKQENGCTLEITVNTLKEIASWIVSRGEGVTVLEPVELKELVISLAKGTLKNYK